MSERKPDSFYIAGIDGGGTKTECAIVDQDSRVVGVGRGGPSNINYVELDDVLESYRDAITSVVGDISDINVTLTGCTHRAAGQPEVIDLIRQLLGGEIRRYSEGEAALACAGIFERYGIAQIAGTGSSTFGFMDGNEHLIGGWGMVLGDEGGAYDIAVKGLHASVRSMDGRGPKTTLLELACSHFEIPSERESFIQLSKNATRDQLASFSVEVTKAAREGDYPASEIVDCAVQELALSITTMANRCFTRDDAFPVVFHGGVLKDEYISSEVARLVTEAYPKADVRTQIHSPGVGLALLALYDVTRNND